MKQELLALFQAAVERLKADSVLPAETDVEIAIERSRQKDHGDFATNLALSLASAAKRAPRELAEQVVAALPQSNLVARTEIAGPGFINVFVDSFAKFRVIGEVFERGDQYGLAPSGSKTESILLEYVSANPTGPLHVGHGRGAAYGDALARLLNAAGYHVHREYYVNDAGRQMNILGLSVWLRYLELAGEPIEFPANAYQGDYVVDMARVVLEQAGTDYVCAATEIEAVRDGLDDEQAIDACIDFAQQSLGEDGYRVFFDIALNTMVDDIRDDLEEFDVRYDQWYSERSLYQGGYVDNAIRLLRDGGHLYEQNGAQWFRSTAFGDEKDRVVIRENGAPTYFAGDIAYHLHKTERGFDRYINIWGADHHGYIARVMAALQALGKDAERLTVLLVQFAILYRGGRRVSMSTRGGQFVSLRELRDEVGSDAARFFYVQRKSEQHMDFDLDLAKSQSNDNPVYYVQYAHARICSVFAQARERDIQLPAHGDVDTHCLTNQHEETLLTLISRFPEVIESAARQYEPHQVTYYLRDLATAFHTYYNAHKFLDADDNVRQARLALIAAVRQVLRNGLTLVGVSAPNKM